MEGKKQWMGDNDFRTDFGKASLNKPDYIENYVFRDPSPPPILHKFRNEDKNKQIAGPFILHV